MSARQKRLVEEARESFLHQVRVNIGTLPGLDEDRLVAAFNNAITPIVIELQELEDDLQTLANTHD